MAVKNFVFFGDSICFGQGISPHQTWVSRLSRAISESNPELTTINTSINGNTTRMALERMPHDVQSHGVHFGLVQFGMNDCNYWVSDRSLPRVSPDAFVANLKEIITRMKASGAQRIILNTNHPTTRLENWNHVPLSYETSNAKYSELIRDVAETFGSEIILNDIALKITEQVSASARHELLLDDRLHLSQKGHDLYFNLTLPIVRATLDGTLGDTFEKTSK